MKYKKTFKILPLFFVLCFMALILVEPKAASKGAADGIILSGRIIVPSLFPFTFCVLFLIRSNISEYLGFAEKLGLRIFSLNAEMLTVFILSFIGGYPVGTRLVDELYTSNKIDKKTAQLMQCYCVNAGPAFIIIAVGSLILHSKLIGVILLISHILSSVFMAFALRKKLPRHAVKKETPTSYDFLDNFSSSAADAASCILSICGYVILFSCFNGCIINLSETIHSLKYLTFLTEITYAVNSCKNIYLLSFILGFGGLSVWFQVISAAKNAGVNMIYFIPSRFLHGGLSTLFTYILLKILRPKIPTFSNGITHEIAVYYSTSALSISLFIMVVIFIISLYDKKYWKNVI